MSIVWLAANSLFAYSNFLFNSNASELYDFLLTACHRRFSVLFVERNDRAATKDDDDEDEKDVEDALLFGMSVLSFCAYMADHYSVLALPHMNSPDPQINMCILLYTPESTMRVIFNSKIYV